MKEPVRKSTREVVIDTMSTRKYLYSGIEIFFV